MLRLIDLRRVCYGSIRAYNLISYIYKSAPHRHYFVHKITFIPYMDPTPSTSMHNKSSGEGDYTCKEWNARFAQPWSLHRHDQAIHWEATFKCTCLRSFSRKDHLKRHQKSCTGEMRVGAVIDTTFTMGSPLPDLSNLPTTKDFRYRKGSSLKSTKQRQRKIIPWKHTKNLITSPQKGSTRHVPSRQANLPHQH